MSLVDQLLKSDIRKPTALTHFLRCLGQVEQRLMTLLIFHCQLTTPDDKGRYFIRKGFVREFLGWEDSNNYPRIYSAFESLYNSSIEWNLLGIDPDFKTLKCRLLVTLLEPRDTGSHIGFRLHPDLEPIIKDPTVFGRIKLIMISILTQPRYAFGLYEILADSYSRGVQRLSISLEQLRELLGVGTAYPEFVPFKKRLLQPAVKAINEAADIRVSYTTYRKARRVAGVIFCRGTPGVATTRVAAPGGGTPGLRPTPGPGGRGYRAWCPSGEFGASP